MRFILFTKRSNADHAQRLFTRILLTPHNRIIYIMVNYIFIISEDILWSVFRPV